MRAYRGPLSAPGTSAATGEPRHDASPRSALLPKRSRRLAVDDEWKRVTALSLDLAARRRHQVGPNNKVESAPVFAVENSTAPS
jgi:hypothetical protein